MEPTHELNTPLVFLDTETTGNEPDDVLLQIAYRTTDDADDVNELFNPGKPIKIGAMAVHHITEKMVADKPSFVNSPAYHDLQSRARDNIFVAHNAKFDVAMLEKEGIHPTRIIDTLKIARALDPQNKIESYALQYLRYLLNIEVEAIAHDAFGDILVLEQLFWRLAKKIMETKNISLQSAVDMMLEISEQPLLIRYFQFGKYKNTSVEEVAKTDPGYLSWLLEQKKNSEQPEMEEDWIYTLEYYLGKR